MAERIDAHHHLWRYTPEEYGWLGKSMSFLQRDFVPQDLKAVLSQANLDGTIVVQARQTIEETRWLLELTDTTSQILGVVGWLPLASPQFPSILASFRDRPNLKAIRHVVQDEPHDFLLGKSFNKGISTLLDSGLVYELLIYAHQLPQALAFVRQHPQQSFVLDHLGKPNIASQMFDQWRNDFLELADCPNVSCKVSGLATQADWSNWTLDGLRPYLDTALEAFGPDRLIAGSDWPVCLMACSYQRWWSDLRKWACEMAPSQQDALFGGNARSIYHLP